jgi:hypothetical protein
MDMTAAVRTALFDDLERELAVTRRVLERVPAERFGWKPHEKSMSLMGLAIHVADLPNWAREALEKDELDFEKAEMPPREVATTEALVAHFDRSAGRLRDVVAGFEVGRLGDAAGGAGVHVAAEGEGVPHVVDEPPDSPPRAALFVPAATERAGADGVLQYGGRPGDGI